MNSVVCATNAVTFLTAGAQDGGELYNAVLAANQRPRAHKSFTATKSQPKWQGQLCTKSDKIRRRGKIRAQRCKMSTIDERERTIDQGKRRRTCQIGLNEARPLLIPRSLGVNGRGMVNG